MQYHIQTTPIWDAFRSGCECPLCAIYLRTAERLVATYLNEAVMEPDERVAVNKRGFCERHLNRLYAGRNKLGLALQLHTRSCKLLDDMQRIGNAKAAKKEAERLRKSLSTCVICDTADEMMERYAYTVAEMYRQESEFPALFAASNGFCLRHYALLLDYVSHAKSAAESYAKALYDLERTRLSEVSSDLRAFADQYDYRASRAAGSAKDALPKMIRKLLGE